jgi:hypothetical protein
VLDLLTRVPDMFRALLRSSLPRDEVFAVTVGASSKKTLASWHLLEPQDVIAAITSLIAADEDDQTLDRPMTVTKTA